MMTSDLDSRASKLVVAYILHWKYIQLQLSNAVLVLLIAACYTAITCMAYRVEVGDELSSATRGVHGS